MRIRGVDYHVVETNAGALRGTLLLLHGFTGSHATYDAILPILAADWHCVTVDLLGHGETDAPLDVTRYEMEEQAADLMAILDQVGAQKASVLGYSMGGRLALGLATLYPERIQTLVLQSASPGLESEQEREARILKDTALADKIKKQGVVDFVADWEKLPLFATQRYLSENVQDKVRAERLNQRAQGLAGSLGGMGTGAQPSFWEELPALHMPTLLLAGQEDQKFCGIAVAMKTALPDAKYITFSNAGHTIHIEQPEAFGYAVRNWLRIRGGTS
ncbi:2-succinyl-6-hydroxy-2,4-cyclohexadiene-1-carboxylate synthase [Listeria newyorkensis]|uniref:Putative 2-succinyl-6-hydroxy-2,4-cyclohexadiene-1-carboxylate synthase n=1 Tax=Listeria newyorkensis TaxID=1497681 RepID=A0A841Z1S5_9LIST|nr:2-succinyl-6-hydroxy-2,4-cyclohexadiene-1-carboxylate synthase [Listeria newyorkensis]MBC1459299.1 2-succinyl-6-hydroxy-2,4-cyclohexadiene-1-carboxylate synthase [Listeria newyorkensis]